jgi:hypothetical protein
MTDFWTHKEDTVALDSSTLSRFLDKVVQRQKVQNKEIT